MPALGSGPVTAVRRLLDTLHPLSDGELEELVRQEKIVPAL